MGSIAYGEGKETQEILSAEPLSKTANTRPAQAAEVREAATKTPVTGLYAPSDDVRPITAGLNRGDGPGSDALMMAKSVVKLSDSLVALLPFDTTGEIAVLYQAALAQGN
jgi:hypothetical protein